MLRTTPVHWLYGAATYCRELSRNASRDPSEVTCRQCRVPLDRYIVEPVHLYDYREDASAAFRLCAGQEARVGLHDGPVDGLPDGLVLMADGAHATHRPELATCQACLGVARSESACPIVERLMVDALGLRLTSLAWDAAEALANDSDKEGS